ncbi:hypothetical protein [Streptomyces sp. 1331.2]|uniref:hypothetical protein n=1 Tax=Streptomyces sp. 1331.2 TaxID=1938835 RepID=UPI000BD2E89C|nr:hypothetical protein [Streptomyces sp. 1331.2]SOB85547.1 hypothetical protein SAMN06272789_5835 [Streptomyces sp. 1331.2]
MDSEIEAMVEAVRAARTKLLEDALPKARTRGSDVPPNDEAALLGALAELVGTAAELVDVIHMRMTRPVGRNTYYLATGRLRHEARNLADGARKVAVEVEPEPAGPAKAP